VRLAFVLTEVGYDINGIIQEMRLLLKHRLFDYVTYKQANKHISVQ
jgi:hypothetical protein